MSAVIIDKELCTGCGVCVDICPYKAIQLVNSKAEYSLAGECFSCGHCQAACPEDAFFIDGMDTDFKFSTFSVTEEMVQPGGMDVAGLVSLMRSRRSCRRYKTSTIPLEILNDLVRIGTTAPSGTNSQPWSFSILPQREDVLTLGNMTADYYRNLNRQAKSGILRLFVKFFGGDRLGRYYRRYHDSVAEALCEWDEDRVDRLFHGAVAAIIVTARKNAGCPAEDSLLATQNILLAAHSMGLGSCLIGFVVEAVRRSTDMKRKLGIDEGEEIYSVIALGYPAVVYQKAAGRKPVVAKLLRL